MNSLTFFNPNFKFNSNKRKTNTETKMLYFITSKPQIPLYLAISIILILSLNCSSAHDLGLKKRTLLGIKETPVGGNVSFDCSPSGPCIPCSRCEKGDENYRCAETVYRIRLKCVPSASGSKDAKTLNARKTRSALGSEKLGVNQPNAEKDIHSTKQRRSLVKKLSKAGGVVSSYVTYRSCIPAVNEEKMSVLGFEALILALLLSSGSFIYIRRIRSAVPGGVPVRLPTSSMF